MRKVYIDGSTAEEIKRLLSTGLSQNKTAKQLGVDKRDVWHVSKGRYVVTKKKVKKIKRGKYFNVDELWNWIVGGAKDLDSKSMAA